MKKMSKTFINNAITYALVIVAFIVMTILLNAGVLTRSMKGQLVPICVYIVMAVSLNLVVGISGELCLGHAGFMSVGAFTGVVAAACLAGGVPNPTLRLILAMIARPERLLIRFNTTIRETMISTNPMVKVAIFWEMVAPWGPLMSTWKGMPSAVRAASCTTGVLKDMRRALPSSATYRQLMTFRMISPKARVTMAR